MLNTQGSPLNQLSARFLVNVNLDLFYFALIGVQLLHKLPNVLLQWSLLCHINHPVKDRLLVEALLGVDPSMIEHHTDPHLSDVEALGIGIGNLNVHKRI